MSAAGLSSGDFPLPPWPWPAPMLDPPRAALGACEGPASSCGSGLSVRSPHIRTLKPKPGCDGMRKRSLWEVTGPGGWAPHEWNQRLIPDPPVPPSRASSFQTCEICDAKGQGPVSLLSSPQGYRGGHRSVGSEAETKKNRKMSQKFRLRPG